MAPRDSQKQRLYNAENAAFKRGHQIANADLQSTVDEIMNLRAVQSRWGQRKVTVELTHGGGRAHVWGRIIRLGTWARNEPVILHEIAHLLIDDDPDCADHGPEFAGVFLFLVKARLGREAWEGLKASFKKYRVRFNNSMVPEPKRPVVTKTARQQKATAAKVAQRERAAREEQALLRRGSALQAARTLRAHIKAGTYGPAGDPRRTKALATARTLESVMG